ncbi:hypothetical protein V500_10579 [Pseudogymnoascus sp. VKM F-4518 (FW-2643)]|nr:hypothetical protein V500_10579 [Pseudogymnoascus sp. VKM F-4518 (FW-2643)]
MQAAANIAIFSHKLDRAKASGLNAEDKSLRTNVTIGTKDSGTRTKGTAPTMASFAERISLLPPPTTTYLGHKPTLVSNLSPITRTSSTQHSPNELERTITNITKPTNEHERQQQHSTTAAQQQHKSTNPQKETTFIKFSELILYHSPFSIPIYTSPSLIPRSKISKRTKKKRRSRSAKKGRPSSGMKAQRAPRSNQKTEPSRR